jgi:hypothetical protein
MWRKTISAAGERQMLPMQTNKTRMVFGAPAFIVAPMIRLIGPSARQTSLVQMVPVDTAC